jgi:hypothetical protein
VLSSQIGLSAPAAQFKLVGRGVTPGTGSLPLTGSTEFRSHTPTEEEQPPTQRSSGRRRPGSRRSCASNGGRENRRAGKPCWSFCTRHHLLHWRRGQRMSTRLALEAHRTLSSIYPPTLQLQVVMRSLTVVAVLSGPIAGVAWRYSLARRRIPSASS